MENRKSLLGFVLLGLTLAACDGSSAALPGSANSQSFSPVFGMTASGSKSDVWWKYLINGGMPLSFVDSNGLSETATFPGDELVRTSGGGTKRATTFGMNISFSDNGDFVTESATSETDEALNPGPPNAVVSVEGKQSETLTVQGMAARIVTSVVTQLSMPTVDFGDRTDLDQLPVGHVDEATVRKTVTAMTTVSVGGMAQSETQTLVSDVHETYTIMEQIPSMAVQGKTCQRVVRVEVKTDATDVSTGQPVANGTSTFWLAAGLGAIKNVASESGLATEVGVELIDTNLSQ